MRLAATVALAALSLAGCEGYSGPVTPVFTAQPFAEWRAVDASTDQIRDVEGLEALAEAFPNSSSVRLRWLNAQLQAGDMEALLGTMGWLHERGYVFSDVAREQIPKLVGDDYAARASALLRLPAIMVERSEIGWTLPSEAGLVESILLDLDNNRMVATSVSRRSLWSIGPGDEWREVAPSGAANLSGIVYDGLTDEIWAASGNIVQSEDAGAGFHGLIGVIKDTRIAAPVGVILSDLHRAGDGTIYASDPIGGGVYRFGPDRSRIEALAAPGTFRSPQGLATSADGSQLYVSDYRYGIAMIELATGAVSRLAGDIPVILDGTDALFRRENSLIAIQNGTSPMRISRFDLSADGSRVVAHTVLEQDHSQWTDPLSGYLAPDALYYVGNGQWDKYVAGELGEGKQLDPIQVRRLPLE